MLRASILRTWFPLPVSIPEMQFRPKCSGGFSSLGPPPAACQSLFGLFPLELVLASVTSALDFRTCFFLRVIFFSVFIFII